MLVHSFRHFIIDIKAIPRRSLKLFLAGGFFKHFHRFLFAVNSQVTNAWLTFRSVGTFFI